MVGNDTGPPWEKNGLYSGCGGEFRMKVMLLLDWWHFCFIVLFVGFRNCRLHVKSEKNCKRGTKDRLPKRYGKTFSTKLRERAELC